MKIPIMIVATSMFCATTMFAQENDDLAKTLGKVSSEYARGYSQPLANAFGADINSGLFHSAKLNTKKPFGFHIYVGIKAFAAMVPDEEKSFSLAYRDTIYYNGTPQGATFYADDVPTIFGEEAPGSVTIDPDNPLIPSYRRQTIGSLINTSIAPLAMLHLELGTLYGTEVMLRILPNVEVAEYGSIGFFGFGVRHSLSQYVQDFPVDVSVMVASQKLSVKDTSDAEVVRAKSLAFNAQVSKSFSILTLYTGLQNESSNMDINYTYMPEGGSPVPIAYEMDGENSFRFLVGLKLGLGPLQLNADYSLGAVTVASGGVGLAF